MRSILQRAATFLSARNGAPPPIPPKNMEARLQKLMARRRADAVAKALDALSDNQREVLPAPLYDSSVYHSNDLGLDAPVDADEAGDDGDFDAENGEDSEGDSENKID